MVLAQHACSSSRKDVVFDPAPVDYMDDRRQPMYSKIQVSLAFLFNCVVCFSAAFFVLLLVAHGRAG